MSGDYPPGVHAGTYNAPWNLPDIPELLPLDCGECGFRAETVEELEDHKHDRDAFTRPEPEDERE